MKNGYLKGWYTAKYLCSEQGFELAAIDRSKVFELSGLINKRFPEVHTVWIGVRKAQYLFDEPLYGNITGHFKYVKYKKNDNYVKDNLENLAGTNIKAEFITDFRSACC